MNENCYEALFWEYDSRVALRWNVDPVQKPMVSPYLVFGANPISFIDPLGNDWYHNKKTHETQWFDRKRDAMKTGFRTNVTNQWIEGDKKGYWIWHGKTKEDVQISDYNSLAPVTVYAKKPRPSLIASSYWGRNLDANAREYRTLTPYRNVYNLRRRDGLDIRQSGDPDSYTSNIATFERHYQIDKAFKDGGAISAGFFIAPFVAIFAVESGAANYAWRFIGPTRQVSLAGGTADLINQKVILRRSWTEINLYSIAANSFLGGRNIISSSLWQSSGGFLNLSMSQQSFGFGEQNFRDFGANFGGNLFGSSMTMPLGWSGKLAEPLTRLEKEAATLPFSLLGNVLSNQLTGQ